ncbi:substrate-binding domain-containing protein [Dictyobacter aurantiacus]|uniref:HTH gntR-type domain-containing protein n=1 Tax=Dictyobacter aurantiacus TaxID=1936993 RepID=A0A401ZQ35_9CHLR|nr:substrate-binding domain-containing protein [Dictyobacter aurantiacus]GCE08981.1 hypothetical protein KDAU_63100 [Dictyobacter aurantiacus]
MQIEKRITNTDAIQIVTPRQLRQTMTKRANAKVERISKDLRALALAQGAGTQLPTIRELCVRLQTSSATLTAALDLLEGEKILCRKERQGIFVADVIYQRTIHIVFNVSTMTNVGQSPFWSLLWVKLLQEAEQNAAFKNEQYRFHFLCLAPGENLPDEYLALLNSPQSDGCLLIGLSARIDGVKKLITTPHVVFAGGGDVMVQIDQQEAARLAMQTLIQQGCKKVGCWVAVPNGPPTNYELIVLDSLKQVAADLPMHLYPEFFRVANLPPTPVRTMIYQEQGYLLAREIFATFNEHRPDGLYISDDMLTSGALVALEELGIEIGKDIKIVTYANAGSPILFGRTKQMASVEVDTADIARALFSALDTAISKGVEPGDTIVPIRPHLYL